MLVHTAPRERHVRHFEIQFDIGCKFCAEGVSRSWCRPRKADLALHCDLTTFRELLSQAPDQQVLLL